MTLLAGRRMGEALQVLWPFLEGDMAVSRRTNMCFCRQTQPHVAGQVTWSCCRRVPQAHTCSTFYTENLFLWKNRFFVWFSSQVFLKEVLLFQMC